MNQIAFKSTMTMTMTMKMTMNDITNTTGDYDYSAFWKNFSFHQVPTGENWEEFSFFEISKRSRNEFGLITPPIIMQTASKESGFFLAEDAKLAINKRLSKEFAMKLQEIREQKSREDAEKEKLELQAFVEAQELKALEAKANYKPEPFKRKITTFSSTCAGGTKKFDSSSKFFSKAVPVAVPQTEAKKKINEKKVLERARGEFFRKSSLLFDDSWIMEIAKELGYKEPSHHLQEIRQKLNVSSLEKPKIVEQEDEIKQIETNSLSDEQVEELAKIEGQIKASKQTN